MENESLFRQHDESMLHDDVIARADFIKKIYLHLAGAILGFVFLEFLLFKSGLAFSIAETLLSISWLLVLGLFMVAAWVAERWAMSSTSLNKQYAGLGLYIVAEAIIFCPLLVIAASAANSIDVIGGAGILTLFLFTGLSFVALTSKTDFSFLGGMLKIGFFIALGMIVVSILFGLQLGTWFSFAMVAFAGGAILYQTGSLRQQYNETQYVAAALGLFASVALMFWYILQIFMSRD